MQSKFKIYISVFITVCFISSCNWFSKKQIEETTDAVIETPQPKITVPTFSSDSAYAYIEKQLSFGPRVPNTKEHEACAAWLIEFAKKHSDTYHVQKYEVTAYDGTVLKSTNIVASLNPTAKKRILLTAHWDTRPFADQDKERKNEAILGANDGASGVAVLLEALRVMRTQKLENIGVDFLFLDSEDYGQPADYNGYVPDSYCLGAQHWSRSQHVPDYKADFGILLDMVGAPGAIFTREGTSAAYAGWVLDRVWNNAKILGHGSYFSNQATEPIVDDHKYINEIAKIPTIDIIHHDPNSASGFGWYWHTHQDDIKAIDKNTLKAVGETVVYSVYEYDKTNSAL
ncbi:MAG: M28 family peptidase [Chitinophagales bacterium]|nr:M28 family peptidase [Chitinophagales bacterium]